MYMSRMFAFMSAVVTVQGSVGMFVVYRELLKVVGFISRCELLCVVYLYNGCDGYCAFCLTCDACNCRCFCMGRMLVQKSTAYTWLDCCCFNAAQIVLTPPAPRNGGPFLPFFGQAGQVDPLVGWRSCY